MKKGDKIKFRYNKKNTDSWLALHEFKEGKIYTGTIIRENTKSLWVKSNFVDVKVDKGDILYRPKPVKKEKAISKTAYKTFSDLCFQMAICIRDDFTSIISGKKGKPFDWQYIQAGHWLSRKYWAIRHDHFNCHAITSGENYQMNLGNVKTIMAYAEACKKKYGQDIYPMLEERSKKSPNLTVEYLKRDCEFCYNFYLNQCINWNEFHTHPNKINGEEILEARLKKQPKSKELMRIFEQLTQTGEF